MSDLERYRRRQASSIGEQAARAALVNATSSPAGFLKVRVIRSVTVGEVGEANDSRSFFIDLAIPPGVPLAAGGSILVSGEDIVTPIAHSFWDHERGVLVVTTQAVTYFGLSLDGASEIMKSRGWSEVVDEGE